MFKRTLRNYTDLRHSFVWFYYVNFYELNKIVIMENISDE